MNKFWARKVLRSALDEYYTADMGDDTDLLSRLSDELETVYKAGASHELHGAIQSSMRRMWKEAELTIHNVSALSVTVLEVKDSGTDVMFIPVRYRDGYDSRGEQQYDYGSYWKSLDAAVVEAIAMKRGLDQCVDGQYANRVLEIN